MTELILAYPTLTAIALVALAIALGDAIETHRKHPARVTIAPDRPSGANVVRMARARSRQQ